MLVDQRGSAGSNDLSCRGPMPSGPTSTFGSLFPPDHVLACRRLLEHHADLSHYHTVPATDDMAQVLDWLGYDRANFLGASYGTRFCYCFHEKAP